MTKQRLVDEIGNFTTIPNSIMELLPELGAEAFMIFSYLRYRTNSKTKTAFPSYITIRQDTGLHPRKIAVAIRKLESLGVLDRNKRFNGTTIYRLHLPKKAKRATCASNSTVGTASSSTVGITGSSNGWKTNKTDPIKIDSNKTELPAAHAAGPTRDTSLYDSAKALATVCKMDFEKNKGRLFAEAKRLGEPASEIIERFGPGRWWYADDWRGQRGEPPTPAQVREVWGQWNLPKSRGKSSQTSTGNPMLDEIARAQRIEYGTGA